MGNSLQKIDDLLMKGVNKGVHAYNWTTGDTKTGLANKFHTSGAILLSTAGITSPEDPVMNYYFAPSWILISHFQQKEYLSQEKDEILAAKNLAKVPESKYNLANKFIGYSAGFLGALGVCASFLSVPLEKKIYVAALGGGLSVCGLSHFVMRADYLPPRKSVVKRVSEKLSKKIKEYNERPRLIPIEQEVYSGRLEAMV